MTAQTFPHEIKSRNGRVRIYRTLNRSYVQFRIADYSTGKRKLKTFAQFDLAVEHARKILKNQKTPTNGRPRKVADKE